MEDAVTVGKPMVEAVGHSGWSREHPSILELSQLSSRKHLVLVNGASSEEKAQAEL